MGNRKKKTVDDTVCEVHKFSGYAVLSNCFVRSTNLGWAAIGLLGRVMDLPPEWNFSKAGLIAICPDGVIYGIYRYDLHDVSAGGKKL